VTGAEYMPRRLKLKVIACDVLNREISVLAAKSPHYIDVHYLTQGLHNTPDKLREEVMAVIRDTEAAGFPYNHSGKETGYDAIILMYGLCSNGLAGIRCIGTPLVLPRAHDCITLLLGSREKYRSLFEANPGTYWFSTGWLERGWQPSEEKHQILLGIYTEHYGEENAEYLMEMENSWIKEYKQALFIAWPELAGVDWGREETEKAAAYLNWAYREEQGDSGLMQRILGGVFLDSEVLVVHAGEQIIPSYDAEVVRKEETV
jgi:hypothetical protein